MSIYQILSFEPLTWIGIASAVISGSLIGLERQLAGKPIGMRTSSLICLGTYIFVVMGGISLTENSDATRVIGQVVTGIGFLGAGVIIAREGAVKGITSASAIWVLAAIGVMIGLGKHFQGIKIAIITVIILTGIGFMEHHIKWLRKGIHPETKKKEYDE